MFSSHRITLVGAGLVALTIISIGCDDAPVPASSFYDERIGPSLEFGCVEQTTGCHIASSRGDATGNLDLTSYDALARRSDTLVPYGPYPLSLLLLKAGQDPTEIAVETFDPPDPALPDNRFVTVQTDIRHAAGTTVALDAANFLRIKQWSESGAQRNGVPSTELTESRDDCLNEPGHAPNYNAADLPGDDAAFNRFVDEVWPIMAETCAGTNCHGNTISGLQLACGDTDEELNWNYFITVEHVTNPASVSELLNRPLSSLRGGTYHEGGNVFENAEDERYLAIRAWAEDLVTRLPDAVINDDPDPGLRFFANRVQPTLVRKGCLFLNCHSPAMFHDLRLRGGSRGVFSRSATIENHEISRQLLALDSPDPNDSRIIAKNLYPPNQVSGGGGMLHRGGFLFEDFGNMGGTIDTADPTDCVGVDADNGDLNTIPAYCVLARWHEIEREAAIASGEVIAAPVESVFWISRPAGTGGSLDFDTFRGGAQLMYADAVFAVGSGLTISGETAANTSACGISAGADIRNPAISWDGSMIAFAARNSEAEPLRLYQATADPALSGCQLVPGVASGSDSQNGILVHDFDPAWAPDARIVFASTRGNIGLDRFEYSGPTLTPAALTPNSNLYIVEGGAVRQLTFLLNQEVSPSFMGDGRLIMTTQKREFEFHQLAGRRQNLDGGDYHPLFAQRESVGFRAATEIVEIFNRNLAFVAAPLDAADGGGAIAIVNRSIGPDQDDRDPGDQFYLSSLDFPAPGALGGMTGAFRSPYPLPGGRLLVSCDTGAGSLQAGGFAYQLCDIDTRNGSITPIGGMAGMANVEAVAVYARADNGVFVSRPDEANGHTEIIPGEVDATINIHDFPLIGTLLFSNTREGRVIDNRIGGFEVLEAFPPAMGEGFNNSDAFGEFYERTAVLGWTGLEADGSAFVRIPGGTPIRLRITDSSGTVLQFEDNPLFTGDLVQREQMMFYPGERSNQSFQRRFFNGLCGGCHGSITNRELDIVVNVDILTSASQSLAYQNNSPVDMF